MTQTSITQALLNRRMLICIFTGFASGLPLYLLISLVPAWLRTEGVGLKEIGFFRPDRTALHLEISLVAAARSLPIQTARTDSVTANRPAPQLDAARARQRCSHSHRRTGLSLTPPRRSGTVA